MNYTKVGPEFHGIIRNGVVERSDPEPDDEEFDDTVPRS